VVEAREARVAATPTSAASPATAILHRRARGRGALEPAVDTAWASVIVRSTAGGMVSEGGAGGGVGGRWRGRGGITAVCSSSSQSSRRHRTRAASDAKGRSAVANARTLGKRAPGSSARLRRRAADRARLRLAPQKDWEVRDKVMNLDRFDVA